MHIKFLQTATLLIGSTFITAQASPEISFSPSAQTFNVGDSAQVDVLISGLEDGLNEIVSAYDLSISFDSSILAFSSINFFETPFGSVGGTNSDPSTAGIIDFSLFSFDSDADLQAAQGDSFVLATLGFDSLAAGTSSLGFDFIDVTGLNFSSLTITALDGEISAVPLPAAFPLMLSAVGAVSFFGSRRKKLATS